MKKRNNARKNNNNSKVFVLAAAALLLLGAHHVFGVQGATVQPGESSRANFSQSSSASVEVQAGNVTQLDISAKSVTKHWAGFYGNISGNITLEDSSGNVFYDWEGLGVPKGEVFASNTSSVSWIGIGCASSDELSSIETSLGINPSAADSIAKTYDSNAHPAFEVSSIPITGCNSTNAYTAGGKDTSLFYQILLTDTYGNPVYTTIINSSTTSFTGAAFDFELLVGEAEAEGTSSLYFYIELD